MSLILCRIDFNSIIMYMHNFVSTLNLEDNKLFCTCTVAEHQQDTAEMAKKEQEKEKKTES